MSDAFWTPEREGALRDAWARGLSGTAIGNFFGVTRGTISGKIHRMGLPARPTLVVKPREFREPRTRDRGYEDRPGIRRAPEGLPSTPADDLAIPMEQRLQLQDLEPWSCRWPVGDVGSSDFFFCGGTASEGRPYCPDHARRAVRAY